MVFARENRRAGRSPPLINSKIHTIIVPEHRAKTPRTEEKEKENWGTAHPLTNALRDCISRSAPPHSDESLSFARQRSEFF